MPWQTPPNFVPLQTLTDTVMNILSDNLDVLFPYTAAGQIALSTAANALGVLDASGNSGKAIVSNGTTFNLDTVSGGLHKFGMVNDATARTTTSTTGVDIANITLDLELTKTCTVIVIVFCSTAVSGGTGIYEVNVNPFIDGASLGVTNCPDSWATQWEPYAVGWSRTGMSGTITCKAQFRIQNSARTANVQDCLLMALAFEE
ncbi:MAG: hypothetical protein HN390_16695 [Anaerolineae bacterium]|mgnify:CR=1 FL=1|jgi:hypothetical protein|nr:hypothetical protein [Anaerolineae bacterium]MBT7192108.1 hypothetical protein [Anaerolineae bacterium]